MRGWQLVQDVGRGRGSSTAAVRYSARGVPLTIAASAIPFRVINNAAILT